MHNTQYSFTGFDHVTEAAQLNLSAKTHIPMTKLFGRSPAGMNATGESDLQNYFFNSRWAVSTCKRPFV